MARSSEHVAGRTAQASHAATGPVQSKRHCSVDIGRCGATAWRPSDLRLWSHLFPTSTSHAASASDSQQAIGQQTTPYSMQAASHWRQPATVFYRQTCTWTRRTTDLRSSKKLYGLPLFHLSTSVLEDIDCRCFHNMAWEIVSLFQGPTTLWLK